MANLGHKENEFEYRHNYLISITIEHDQIDPY